jgi:hypothetical protein
MNVKDAANSQRVWIGVIVAVGVVVFGGLIWVSHHSTADEDGGAYVKVACRDWVKDRLKAPTSADFSQESVSRNGQTYVVTGAVDSANSFGAPIRNTYRCEATHDGEASHLVALTGIED